MKKYFIFILISFFIVGIFDVKALNPLKNKVIVIDPGHGGIDPGTIYKDIYEKDLVLAISLYLKSELENKGANVILTRNGDYDLSKPGAIYRKKSDFDNRIRIINDYADFYLSIHLNYLDDSQYSGIQVFSTKDNMLYANNVQNYLNKSLLSNRNSKIISSQIYMYQRLNKPGLLIECGFLSNEQERLKLITNKYQKKVAKEIANAIFSLTIK